MKGESGERVKDELESVTSSVESDLCKREATYLYNLSNLFRGLAWIAQ